MFLLSSFSSLSIPIFSPGSVHFFRAIFRRTRRIYERRDGHAVWWQMWCSGCSACSWALLQFSQRVTSESRPLPLQSNVEQRRANGGSDIPATQYSALACQGPVCVNVCACIWVRQLDDHWDVVHGMKRHEFIDERCNLQNKVVEKSRSKVSW